MKSNDRIQELLIRLIALVTTLICISLAGQWTLSQDNFPNVKRFWTMQSPAVNFFPTARQTLRWALDNSRGFKTVIVFGGSSVILGNGQPVDQTISENLQRHLGKRAKVLNLAVRGGGPFGQGLYVANALTGFGKQVIFISDYNPGYVPPIKNNPPYQYFYWQSKFAGYLGEGPLSRLEESETAFFPNQLEVLAHINHYLKFMELSNYVSYKFISLNHSEVIGEKWFSPLGAYPDDEVVIPYEQRYLNEEVEASAFKRVQGQAQISYSKSHYQWVASEHDRLIQGGKKRFEKVVLLSFCENPRYVDKLSKLDRQKYLERHMQQTKAFDDISSSIIAVPICTGLTDADYADVAHLAPTGASKVAELLSKVVP